MVPILYSTTSGTSLDMESVTESDSGVALVKKLRYRNANVSSTESFRSMTTSSSSFSGSECGCRVVLPLPSSPLVLKLTPSFVALITTESPMELRSRQMRWNSPEGSLTVTSYSLSCMGKKRGNGSRVPWVVVQSSTAVTTTTRCNGDGSTSGRFPKNPPHLSPLRANLNGVKARGAAKKIEGIRTGMPRCSLSISISFISYSETRSPSANTHTQRETHARGQG